MFLIVFKSLLHNVGVIFVGLVLALFGVALDTFFKLPTFQTPFAFIFGLVFLLLGFCIRVWATYYFYRFQMKVISLVPQKKLITEGPFRFSRNPLYLGGNVCIFFGAAYIFGSPAATALTILGLFLTDSMIRKEEKQLEKTFGTEWLAYKKHVRRWL